MTQPPPDPPPDPAQRDAACRPLAETDGHKARWRVLLVRIPPGTRAAIEQALPLRREIRPRELPLQIRTTNDWQSARGTARRLRDAGAIVLITEEPPDPDASAFCDTHPTHVASRNCTLCGEPHCSACTDDAHGEHICRQCHVDGRSPKRRTRLRQLFVLFLFSVFLFQVAAHLSDDKERVDPFGTVDVAVLQFSDAEAQNAPIVRAMNGLGPAHSPSLHDIGPWFNAERLRYGGPERWLRPQILGPWGADLNPPDLATPDLNPLQMMLRSWQYARYFRGLSSDRGIEEKFAAQVYVIYGDPDADTAAHSRGSEKGRLAIAWVSERERNPAYAVLTVMHEMAHTLGADDTYDPGSYLAQHPEGFVEPFADPLYPQRYGELMAVDIPVSKDREREPRELAEVFIGHHTAAGMGWISPQAAALYYSPPSTGPDERLPSARRAQSEPLSTEQAPPSPSPPESPLSRDTAPPQTDPPDRSAP